MRKLILLAVLCGCGPAEGRDERMQDMQSQIDSLSLQLIRVRIDLAHEQGNYSPDVDLTSTNVQKIGGGYLVEGLTIAPHQAGVEIRGRVINPYAVGLEYARFSVGIGTKRGEFTVVKVAPGRARFFNVYVPGVPAEADGAKITPATFTMSWRE